jgi:lipopolysaccharide transport system permease protein
VVKPGRAGPPFASRQLAGLLWTIVRTDFKVRYHGTLGGFGWALLKPLAMFLVLMSVFSFIFSGDRHYGSNLIIGLCLWDFFAEATKVGIVSLLAKSYLVTKTRFPLWILVVTSCSNALLTLLVFLAAILAYLVGVGRPPAPAAIGLLLLYVLALLLIAVGISLGGSVLFLRYRDLNQVWEVIVQAGFFVAPVVFPIGILPERFHAYLYLWAPTPVIQFSRSVLVNGVIPSWRGHVLLAGMALVVLLLGIVIYRAAGPRAMETL